MSVLKRCKKLHLWLLSALLVLVLFWLLRGNRDVMNWLAGSVVGPLKRWLGSLCACVEGSVAELLIATFCGGAVLWLAHLVGRLFTEKRRWETLYRHVLVLACGLLTVYAGFSLLWGIHYYTDTFQDQSGIYARQGTVEELEELTKQFALGLTETSEQMQRDENGLAVVDRQQVLDDCADIYETLYEEFPFLDLPQQRPKGITCSNVLGAMGYTGFYFPFTGETNLNMESPACYLPATVVHELAHQRDIASEQECNFLAILGCLRSEDPVYRYSGYLLGFTHLSNALYRADPDRWPAIREMLPEGVVADMRSNNAYWDAQEMPLSQLWDDIYDGFLKSYGDSDGVQSYGMVVELLLAYYLPSA
ncbi:MAG: DUF3810 domain-containing protein [Ruminococcaceae bacterium]|nr:DUF3810 domain-containing protein [Oscillospiraceae bacterium]